MKCGVELQLIDIGSQGIDHPMRGFKDKSFYIKYLLYTVRRGTNE
jgi:23S rRNA (cytosine1962-C5)-methyltransferase